MTKQWEVKIRPRVKNLIQGMSKQETKKFTRAIDMLKQYGPYLTMMGEHAQSLKNSRYALNELRVRAGRSVWRFAYHIDKNQVAHILSGGDKRGVSKRVFYNRLIADAEREIDATKRGE